MSFLRIRSSRAFGDFHKLFATSPVFPEEKVKTDLAFDSYLKLDKLRKKRMWLHIEKERIERKIKKQVFNISTANELMKPPEDQKSDQYYESRGLIGKDDPVSELFDVDKKTLLPYGLGYDEVIRSIKEKNQAQASQDKVRDIWMRLGFVSVIHVINSTDPPELNESIEKINRKIYTSRHKTEEIAYKDIELQEHPRSQKHQIPEPEYFSDDNDSDDGGSYDKYLKKAKEKYKNSFLNFSGSDAYYSDDKGFDDTTESASGNDDEQMEEESEGQDPGPTFPTNLIYSPYFPVSTLLQFNKMKKRKRRQAFENAAKIAKNKLDSAKTPLFKIFSPRDLLKKTDLDHNLRIRYGFVPSFSELLLEAEMLIMNDPTLSALKRRDDYEKNTEFEPRYLGKTMNSEEFLWSFMPKSGESLYPGYITGRLPFREDPDFLSELYDSAQSQSGHGYRPDQNDLSLKVYSLMKNDPYHSHFLNNHIKFMTESIRETIEGNNGQREMKAKPMIPWEYITVLKPQVMKPARNKPLELDEEGYFSARGKRKCSNAKALLRPGTGLITVNGKSLISYCPDFISRDRVIQPFRVTKLVGMYDAKIFVGGGGFMGQGKAMQLAVARAIIRLFPDSGPVLHEHGLLTRDVRTVERKKTSKHKARKSYTYVKR